MSTKTASPDEYEDPIAATRACKANTRRAFGKVLSEKRKARAAVEPPGEFSQEGLSDKMGESRPTVLRLESGLAPVELHTVLRAAKALDCSPVDLLAPLFPTLSEEIAAAGAASQVAQQFQEHLRRSGQALSRGEVFGILADLATLEPDERGVFAGMVGAFVRERRADYAQFNRQRFGVPHVVDATGETP